MGVDSVAGLACSRSLTRVMTAASIGASRGGGYARYLESKTVAPERGDYYLTPDGEMTQAPGRWLSEPDTLAALGVEPGGPVEGADFIALMEGRHPGTGRWLRPEGAGGGRGGGIDVTFSAPKSVSVVWALGDPCQREQIEAAHARAVEQTVLYLREQVPVVRRRYGGQVVEEHARDVIAAEYRHTTARGVAGAQAPDPQLHSHVVISGAVREDERIVAVSSRPIFRSARELGAFYRSQLAHELASDGYRIRYGTGKDGRYFELAGVPQALLEEFSGVAVRLPGPPSVSVPATAGRRSVGSCVAWRSRTAAPSSPQPGQTYSRHGPRPGVATGSGPTRRCGCWRVRSASAAVVRWRIASRRG
jgi:conjugative relaxase-like TrwC/TraI family protein